MLGEYFFQRLRVPTNTTEEWYTQISTLGTDHISTAPFYSSDESWINIKLTFVAPTMAKTKSSADYHTYKIATISAPNILVQHKELREHVTCVSEYVRYPSVTKDFDFKIKKDLNFVFRKDVFVAAFRMIHSELSAALRSISEECELLQQDNLARGKIVEGVGAGAYVRRPEGKDPYWEFSYSALAQPYRTNQPNEYWGSQIYTEDIIGALVRYPWMPEDISTDEFPF